ncbi:hypothetical protein [Tabrizicola flagellatus]|uniref:hypothetical protein n=1 Tax=Tabrizicola flagellatus TaxID=2593021 RepID=UPI0011F284EB|nr:hypothetical protein [Tabrizicola flagellatus]
MTLASALVLLLAALAFALAPIITPPFTGYDPGQFPVEIAQPAVQPAGYAFAIWSLIYLWLILHAAFGLWKRQRHPAWVRVRPALTLAVVLGTVWLAIAASSPFWATVVILVMAGAAILAFLQAPTEPDRWLLSAPLAIFAGWLTAASAVSTGVLLAGYGYLGNEEAAYDMMAAVLILGVLVQWRKPRMPVYGLTLAWALVGIGVANWGSGTPVAWVAFGIAALTLVAVSLLARRGKGQIP